MSAFIQNYWPEVNIVLKITGIELLPECVDYVRKKIEKTPFETSLELIATDAIMMPTKDYRESLASSTVTDTTACVSDLWPCTLLLRALRLGEILLPCYDFNQ
jgi:hypothetical protein